MRLEISKLGILMLISSLDVYGYSPIQKNCDQAEIAGDWFCYSYHHDVPAVSWQDASDKCSQMNATLASIGLEKDWNVLSSNVPASLESANIWIGVYQEPSNPGVWRWEDGAKYAFTKWDNVGEEDISVPPGGCKAGYMDPTSGKYFSADCSSLQDGYMCKKGRIRVYEMGEPWEVYIDPTNPEDRRQSERPYLRESFFFEPPEVAHVLTNINVLDTVLVRLDVQCSQKCMKNDQCIYAQAICVDPDCSQLECTFKGAP